MAITASGLYGITLKNFLISATAPVAGGLQATGSGVKGLLVTDTYTHNYDTDAFRNLAGITSNEISSSGTNYTTGGNAPASAGTVTVGSPSAGVIKYTHGDYSWSNSTITNAMAVIGYFNTGNSATDQLIYLLDFVNAVSTSSGLLSVTIAANGVFNLDYTP